MKRLIALLTVVASSACYAPHIAGMTALNGKLIVAAGGEKDASTLYSCDITADGRQGSCVQLKLVYP